MSNKPKDEKAEAYPWATLYNLESGIGGSESGYTKSHVGRPFRPFPRRAKTTYLSDEEISIINRNLFRIREAMRPSPVTQYQLIGLALRLLDDRMRLLPERVATWDDVVKALFEGDK